MEYGNTIEIYYTHYCNLRWGIWASEFLEFPGLVQIVLLTDQFPIFEQLQLYYYILIREVEVGREVVLVGGGAYIVQVLHYI